jgi:hypothetical protein
MLNYKNFDDLITAFNKNNNFRIKVVSKHGFVGYKKIISMEFVNNKFRVESEPFFEISEKNQFFINFNFDGSYKFKTFFGDPVTLEEIDIPVVKSFVERFYSGENVICLKERLNVLSFYFERFQCKVKFYNAEKDIYSYSDNYNADGTHQFDSTLDLTFGELPPIVKIYKAVELYMDNVLQGVYQNVKNNGNFAIVCSCNNQVIHYSKELNKFDFIYREHEKYILTDKKFEFSIND